MSDSDASAAKAVGLSDYIAAMKKTSFTQNWDVTVTYDQQKINDLLAQRFKEPNNGMVSHLKFSVDGDSPYGEYTQWYEFTLGPPLIQFESGPNLPTCSLKTVITEGKIKAIDKATGTAKEEVLKQNAYTISINNINLGAVTGNAQELKDPKKASQISGADHVVVFPADGNYSSHIVIDLPTSPQLSFSVGHPSVAQPPYAMKRDALLTALRDHFTKAVSSIHYTLAIVNNTKPSDGTTDLVPKSLRFATMRISDEQSYLTLFIQTQSSDVKGNTDALQSRWISEWSIAGVHPIPKDNSASIIINNSFFVRAFINAALARYEATGEGVRMSDEDGGIRVKGTWPKLTRREANWTNPNEVSEEPELHTCKVHSVEYDPNSGGSPLQITITQSNGNDQPATVAVDWSYSYNNTWSGKKMWKVPEFSRITDRIVGWSNKDRNVTGTFKATYSLSKKTDLVTLDDESLTVNVGVQRSDWSVDTKPEEGSDLWDRIAGAFGGTVKEGNIPGFAKESAIDMINFGFDFGKLRFFSLTNVLLPGRKVIDVDVTSGVRVPRDVVVVGNVVKSLA